MSRMTLTALLAAGLVAAAAAPASAAPGALDTVKQALSKRIDSRIGTLTSLSTVVSGAKRLTADHRAALSSLIATDISGLTALKTKVAGEQTADAVRADATSMVDDYRVYLLVVPEVRLTVAADAAATAKDTLQQVHDKLAAADGNGVAAAPLTDMQTALSNAQCGTGSLLGLSAGPDASAIASAVKAARSGLGTCRTALKKALSDAKSARQLIKG